MKLWIAAVLGAMIVMACMSSRDCGDGYLCMFRFSKDRPGVCVDERIAAAGSRTQEVSNGN
jgi:hypothetical protein